MIQKTWGEMSVVPFSAEIHGVTNGATLGTVGFGTEATYFQDADMSVVVYGPGSIEQAHKPDEFISLDQLE